MSIFTNELVRQIGVVALGAVAVTTHSVNKHSPDTVENMVKMAIRAYESIDTLLFIKNEDFIFYIKRDWDDAEIETINRIRSTILELFPMLPSVSNDLKAKLKEIDNE